jgi:RNA polymerase-associated protein RTF1
MLTRVMGRLNEMPEMEREQILAQRQEQMQSRTDKFNLSKLLAAQDIGASMADDSVAQAAKRASVFLHPYLL